MATRAEVEQAKRALRRISDAAKADLNSILAAVDPEDRQAVRRVLTGTLPEVLTTYGWASAALGADMSEVWLSDLGVKPTVVMASAATTAQAVGAVDWAMSRPNTAGSLGLVTDVMVKDPYRSTIAESAHASRAGWARVPTGAKTCAFCVMMASRGAVYRSAQRAHRSPGWHGDCDCQIVMVSGDEGWPEGHDPATYYDRYLAGRAEAEALHGSKPSTEQILAGMRSVLGLH